MQFTDKMLEYREKLRELGHDAFLTDLHKAMVGKTCEEIEVIKLHQKNNMDAIREFWRMIEGIDTNEIDIKDVAKKLKNKFACGGTAKDGYIELQGNHLIKVQEALMEIGFAHVLNQKIFMLNPIPEMPYCKTEIEAVKPIIIEGDLKKII